MLDQSQDDTAARPARSKHSGLQGMPTAHEVFLKHHNKHTLAMRGRRAANSLVDGISRAGRRV